MTTNYPQVPWTDEQWALVTQTVQKEASRARVAATFLPLFGPLPPDTDFVRADKLEYKDSPEPKPPKRISVDDKAILLLATLYVKVWLRGAQMEDPNLTSALLMFRRAANVLARLEDAIVFRGQEDRDKGPPDGSMPDTNEICG
ncbi:MAG: encapsulin, partial [Roseiarcus sp.]